MKVYDEDVIEDALNFGLNHAATRFLVPVEHVYKLVKAFKDSMTISRCPCEQARQKGISMMCFVCEGEENPTRIMI